MAEAWKPLAGEFSGWPYEVSSDGRVRRVGSRVRATPPDTYGYPRVGLHMKGKTRFASVHRLVATAFLGPPADGDQVNHKDGDKSNNTVGNLEWCTCRENIHHAKNIGLRKFLPLGKYKRKLTDRQVLAIRMLHDRGVTDTFLGRWLGVAPPTVRMVRLGMTYADVA